MIKKIVQLGLVLIVLSSCSVHNFKRKGAYIELPPNEFPTVVTDTIE